MTVVPVSARTERASCACPRRGVACGSRHRGDERGFTLVELLVALLVTLLVVAAAVGLATVARRSFLVEPAVIDTVRRLHAGADALAGAIADAGGDHAIGDGIWSVASSFPRVMPMTSLDNTPGDAFRALRTLHVIPQGVARLAVDQFDPAASLTVDVTGRCPAVADLCGFGEGDRAVVFDGRGAFDVFEVAAVSAALARLTPASPLGRAYEQGSWVVTVREDRFGLVAQPDGLHTLTRVTGAGAREPLVDGVVSLEIAALGAAHAPWQSDAVTGRGESAYGLHPPAAGEVDRVGWFDPGSHCMTDRTSGVPLSTLAALGPVGDLAPVTPAMLGDGPWCPDSGATSPFDADVFRIRRLDITLRVAVLSAEFRGPSSTLFAQGGTAVEAAKWVTDRTVTLRLAVKR
ncbi:MAG: prepilin-type N-terminal cleavage/methylation domain-containing protein [Acidobacteria bacterium]|nr:prepilin-type N-terminal cleavage/methylation domain-containing protein [Acidobacteriota bacterium]